MTLALCALVGAGGCNDEDPATPKPPPAELVFEYETEHLDIHSDVERCEGDFARWESFIAHTEDYLGLEAPETIELFVWETDEFDGLLYCEGEFAGCVRESRTRIYAKRGVVEHELVHTITTSLPNKDSFFDEGLAEALSTSLSFGEYAPWFPVAGSLDVDYPSAGHFVRWLLETRGWDTLRSHMNTTGTVEAFEDVYGQSLSAITEAYFAEASWNYPRAHEFPAPAFEARGEGVWASELVFDCGREDVRGAEDGRTVIRELTLPRDSFYAFWNSTGGPVSARLKDTQDLGPTDFDGRGFSFSGDQIVGRPIDAGRYELTIFAPDGVDDGQIIVWENLATTPTPP